MKKEKLEKLLEIYKRYLDGRELTLEEQTIFIDGYLLGKHEMKLKHNLWNIDKESQI